MLNRIKFKSFSAELERQQDKYVIEYRFTRQHKKLSENLPKYRKMVDLILFSIIPSFQIVILELKCIFNSRFRSFSSNNLFLQLNKIMNRTSLGQEESSLVASYKIIILGMASAGKTKLLTRYKYGNYIDEGSQTMMVDCTYVYRNRVKYNYYDTAGQQKYRSILNLYFKGSDAAILVYSVDSMQSFEELEYYYKELINVVPDCKIYVIGCKNDLKKSVTKERAKEKFKAVKYFECSAKLDQGVYEAFHQIQNDLLQLKKEKRVEKFQLDCSKMRGKKKQKCCSTN